MDATTFWLIVLVILAAVAVIGFYLYRRNARAKPQLGPADIEYAGKTTAPAPPAAPAAPLPPPAPAPAQPDPSDVEVEITNIKSHAGGARFTGNSDAHGAATASRTDQNPPKAT